jgi:hypothetical protein
MIKNIGKTGPLCFRHQDFHIIPTSLGFQTIPLILLVGCGDILLICSFPNNNFDLVPGLRICIHLIRIHSGSRVLMTKNWERFTAESITTIYLISWPLKRTSKSQKKPSAPKREYPALQNMKFLNFFTFVVIFALLDPDQIRIRIRNPAWLIAPYLLGSAGV